MATATTQLQSFKVFAVGKCIILHGHFGTRLSIGYTCSSTQTSQMS